MSIDHIFQQPEASPNDIRFIFEIVSKQSDSVRVLTDRMLGMQEQLGEALLRLERIEAKETSAEIKAMRRDIDALVADKHRRDGATGVFSGFFRSPAIAWIVGAFGVAVAYFEGRG